MFEEVPRSALIVVPLFLYVLGMLISAAVLWNKTARILGMPDAYTARDLVRARREYYVTFPLLCLWEARRWPLILLRRSRHKLGWT